MYGIFTYIYHKKQPNVGKYTIHGLYGIYTHAARDFVEMCVDLGTPGGDEKRQMVDVGVT